MKTEATGEHSALAGHSHPNMVYQFIEKCFQTHHNTVRKEKAIGQELSVPNNLLEKQKHGGTLVCHKNEPLGGTHQIDKFN